MLAFVVFSALDTYHRDCQRVFKHLEWAAHGIVEPAFCNGSFFHTLPVPQATHLPWTKIKSHSPLTIAPLKKSPRKLAAAISFGTCSDWVCCCCSWLPCSTVATSCAQAGAI